VKPGLTVILGPNGAGKTTLLRALAGCCRARARCCSMARRCRRAPMRSCAAGIALVAEGRQLFPQMTVHREPRARWLAGAQGRTRQRLEQVERLSRKLRERATQLAGTMSGGEQQMVAVARAMMSAPRLLMLDEPSLGLAPRMVDELLAIARRIAGRAPPC
jgi:branched-chain amino acid transport system ATP-binding protein